jgi:hypothetical protein
MKFTLIIFTALSLYADTNTPTITCERTPLNCGYPTYTHEELGLPDITVQIPANPGWDAAKFYQALLGWVAQGCPPNWTPDTGGTPTPTPEPGYVALVGAGLMLTGLKRRG